MSYVAGLFMSSVTRLKKTVSDFEYRYCFELSASHLQRSRVTSGKLQSIEVRSPHPHPLHSHTRAPTHTRPLHTLHTLQDFMDPMGNFSIYRHHLEKAVSEANQGKSGQRWVVPFFSLIVKDIYFMQQSSGK